MMSGSVGGMAGSAATTGDRALEVREEEGSLRPVASSTGAATRCVIEPVVVGQRHRRNRVVRPSEGTHGPASARATGPRVATAGIATGPRVASGPCVGPAGTSAAASGGRAAASGVCATAAPPAPPVVPAPPVLLVPPVALEPPPAPPVALAPPLPQRVRRWPAAAVRFPPALQPPSARPAPTASPKTSERKTMAFWRRRESVRRVISGRLVGPRGRVGRHRSNFLRPQRFYDAARTQQTSRDSELRPSRRPRPSLRLRRAPPDRRQLRAVTARENPCRRQLCPRRLQNPLPE